MKKRGGNYLVWKYSVHTETMNGEYDKNGSDHQTEKSIMNTYNDKAEDQDRNPGCSYWRKVIY